MMEKIPQEYLDLVSDETKAYAVLATIQADGTPQNTPVWFDMDGDHILINSVKGRVKDENMRERRNVAIVILDPRNPYRYIQLRGEVIDFTTDGAVDHIHRLSRKYRGRNYDLPARQERVIYRIRIDHVQANG